mmetsp:Transcript_9034/g.37253  ORF Transcript_9034/g.37253 Transcript_9034/m.37253 type:complete len:270 (+) Transcript_9034:1178-1987(+)
MECTLTEQCLCTGYIQELPLGHTCPVLHTAHTQLLSRSLQHCLPVALVVPETLWHAATADLCLPVHLWQYVLQHADHGVVVVRHEPRASPPPHLLRCDGLPVLLSLQAHLLRQSLDELPTLLGGVPVVPGLAAPDEALYIHLWVCKAQGLDECAVRLHQAVSPCLPYLRRRHGRPLLCFPHSNDLGVVLEERSCVALLQPVLLGNTAHADKRRRVEVRDQINQRTVQRAAVVLQEALASGKARNVLFPHSPPTTRFGHTKRTLCGCKEL